MAARKANNTIASNEAQVIKTVQTIALFIIVFSLAFFATKPFIISFIFSHVLFTLTTFALIIHGQITNPIFVALTINASTSEPTTINPTDAV